MTVACSAGLQTGCSAGLQTRVFVCHSAEQRNYAREFAGPGQIFANDRMAQFKMTYIPPINLKGGTVKSSMSAGWDYAAALERVGGDESLLVELIAVFFEDYPKFASRLTQSLSQKDFATLRDTAHWLKGSLGYLGASDGEALALAVERASASYDAARAGELVAQLMAYIEALRQLMLSPTQQPSDQTTLQ